MPLLAKKRMKIIAAALQLLALTTAFVAPQQRMPPSTPRRRTTPMTMVTLPRLANPLPALQKQLGHLLMAPPPPPPGTVVEGAQLFRTLGIAPNAEFPEVQRAVAELKDKYKDDKKMCMKLEITKDKIVELRLKQRTQGSLGVTQAAAKVDRNVQLLEKTKLKRAVQKNTPRWVKRLPLMWKPYWDIKNIKNNQERKWAMDHVRQSYYMFLFLEGCSVLLPIAVGFVKYFSLIYFFFHLCTKGKEPVKRGPSGMVAEVRPEIWEDYAWCFFLLAPIYLSAWFFAQATLVYLPFVRPYDYTNAVTTAALFFADANLQPHVTRPSSSK